MFVAVAFKEPADRLADAVDVRNTTRQGGAATKATNDSKMVAAKQGGDHQHHRTKPTYRRLLVEGDPLTELIHGKKRLGAVDGGGHKDGG